MRTVVRILKNIDCVGFICKCSFLVFTYSVKGLSHGILQIFDQNCSEISGRKLTHKNIIFERLMEDMILICG